MLALGVVLRLDDNLLGVLGSDRGAAEAFDYPRHVGLSFSWRSGRAAAQRRVLGLSLEVCVDLPDDPRSLAHRGRDPLRRSRAHIADRKNAGYARLEVAGCPRQQPIVEEVVV